MWARVNQLLNVRIILINLIALSPAILVLTFPVSGRVDAASHISPDLPTVLAGRGLQMEAKIGNGKGKENVTDRVTWVSSNARVARIERSGGLIGVTGGTATITAVFHGQQASTQATVTEVSVIEFSGQPSTTPVDAIIRPPVTVIVRDNLNRPVESWPVFMSLGPSPPNPATLNGPMTGFTDLGGQIVFDNLTLDYLGNGYTLLATTRTQTHIIAATSVPFAETRVGDLCLGPTPACSSTCADSDNDGLNDAWEVAGGPQHALRTDFVGHAEERVAGEAIVGLDQTPFAFRSRTTRSHEDVQPLRRSRWHNASHRSAAADRHRFWAAPGVGAVSSSPSRDRSA